MSKAFLLLMIVFVFSGVVAAQESTAEPTPPEPTVTPDLTLVPVPTEILPTLTPTPDTRRWVQLGEDSETFGAIDLVMSADTSFSVIVQLVQTLLLIVWFFVWLMRERD